MRRLQFDNKGSMTVEACIVVPVVFLSVIAVMYAVIFLYQYVYIQSLADKAAERGAAVWNSPVKDMYIAQITVDGMKKRDPYWRLTELFGKGTQKKRDRVKDYINFEVKKYSAFKNKDSGAPEVKIPDLTNYVIYQKLRVTVKDTYKLPVKGLLKPFGIGEEFTITASSEAVISDPAEFIRNTDFVMDVSKEVGSAIDTRTNGKFSSYGRNVSDFFSNLAGKVGGLVDKLSPDKKP